VTSVIALIGHPVAHSISPAFQQAALDALGVDARYEAWDTPEDELEAVVGRLRAEDVLGANVTVPHKVAMLRLIDEPDALVERVGALNTIVRRGSVLHATNTDVTGILQALADGGVSPAGKRVLLLGAGGAARAVVTAMREARATSIVVANRTLEHARALESVAGDALPLDVCPLDPESEALQRAMGETELVVHSTSLGMRHGPDEATTPVPARLFRPGQVAFDLVYVPERTPFIQAAERGGAQTIGGLAMLVHQGAAAFRLWTGLEPPLEVMFRAARDALEGAA